MAKKGDGIILIAIVAAAYFLMGGRGAAGYSGGGGGGGSGSLDGGDGFDWAAWASAGGWENVAAASEGFYGTTGTRFGREYQILTPSPSGYGWSL